jgi:hypothetical protein
MSFSNEQIVWISELAGQVPTFLAAEDLAETKARLIAAATDAIEAKVGQIKLGQDYVAAMKSEGISGWLRESFKIGPATMPAISEGGPDQEVDTGRDAPKLAGLTAEQAKQLTDAQAVIAKQVETLREALDETTRKKLFTDAEISTAIWLPLMRRKIIPENAVPSRFSEVSRGFAAGSEDYDARLAAYTESLSDNAALAAKLGVGKEVIDKLGVAANAALTMAKAVAPGMKDVPLTTATDICTAVTATLSGGLDITATVLKDGKIDATNVDKIAKSVVAAAAGAISAAFDVKFPGTTTEDKVGLEIGKAISTGLKIGLSGVTFCAKVAQGGDKAKEAVDDFASIVEQCCACAGSAVSVEKGVVNDKATATVGRYVKQAILGCKELGMLLTAEKPEQVAKALQGMVKIAIDEGSQQYMAVRKAARAENQTPGEKTFDSTFVQPADTARQTGGVAALGAVKLDDLLAMAQTLTPEQLQEKFKSDPKIKGDKAIQKLMETAAAKRDQEMKTAAEAMNAEVEADDADFRNLLSASESGDGEDTIERLILEIKKDQMVLQLAENLLTMPAAAVAAFLPPASIAVSAIAMAASLRKAIKHAMAWSEWKDNTADAQASMNSVQVAAMANRAGLSGGKAIEESVKTAEAAIKLLGDVFSTVGGPFAPIGVAVSKGTAAGSALKDIILKLYQEAELAANWKKYVAARNNPEDRKGLREAIGGNPTLAKYVIAYGAVVAEDPVARNALKKCGLSSKVLQSKDTNTQKVVSYLETLYADDPVLLEQVEAAPDWYPGPIALSSTSITAFSFAAQKQAKPKLDGPIPAGIAKCLVDAEDLAPKLAAARKAWEDAVKKAPQGDVVDSALAKVAEDFVAQLNQMASACRRAYGEVQGWSPRGADKKPHAEAIAYRAVLVRMAKAKLSKAVSELEMYE